MRMTQDQPKETLRRVQDGLYHLHKGLTPFVQSRMQKAYGSTWLRNASRAAGGGQDDALDTYGLVKTMIDQWPHAFADAFAQKERQRARTFTSIALDARNATSHLSLPMEDSEALRYLDAIHQLIRLAKADEKEVAEVKALYDAQRRGGLPATSVAAAAKPAPIPEPPPPPPLDLAPVDGSVKALKPWIEVALPHPDVIANRFKEAEFAADLFAVDAGHAEGDYANPQSFFRITFLTEGLKRVLTAAVQRLAGAGGDPVIGLQTAFGGGKTHTMLALFHLAKHLQAGGKPDALTGMAPLTAGVSVKAWPRPKLAVFVGSAAGPDVSLSLRGGAQVRTLWGYIAWRIAGDAGLKLVAEAEAARTNPGSDLLVKLFKLAGPSLILLDELTMFARQLEDDRFEAFLSFIQSLTEAAKLVPGILVVGSLPESQAEAGGERGLKALLRLEKVFGRVQSPWLPAQGDETYEIIRRRLFQPLDAEGERARDETVKAFFDLYRKNAAEFPAETREARYQDLLRLSYPIHPELFDRLSKDWGSLPKFQRTRGVLRFMANVIGVLWHAQVKDPLITPARVPVAHERVRASLLYPLDPAFAAVVDKEVDGDGALPARMEQNPARRISQARAATRAARAVFVCSAPLAGQANAGLNGQGLRLACAEPSDQLAIFGEALRELTERAVYLYEEAGRYWFSTQPTLNRLAEDRARDLLSRLHEVDAEIVRMLAEDAGTKGGFHRVHAAPDDPTSIDEAQALSLVILGPGTPHSGRGASKSPATDAVTDALTRCRASQRRFRNSLLYVAPDDANLATAREVVARAMAWELIVRDTRLQQQMTNAQEADAKDKAKTNADAGRRAVRAAWSHILYPMRSDAAGRPFDLEHAAINARDRAAVPVTVYEKAKSDGLALEKLGAETLWLKLKPIWPVDRPHLLISEVADWFASYVYLPRLRDRVVLDNAIREALAKLDSEFAYAEGFDESTGRYRGLVWAKSLIELPSGAGVLVRATEARAQLAHDGGKPRAEPAPIVPGQPGNTDGTGGAVGPGGPTPKVPSKPRRFYGSVEIDTLRPMKAFDAIITAVVAELQRTGGAKVRLTLEIEAEAPDGFDESEVGVVRDNAKQLKFRPESTGFEE
jgi:predicted AAA+ superfamily ATPase